MHEAVRVHRALPCASVFAYCTRIGKTHFVRHEASLKRWVGAEAKPEEARKSWLERMLPETSEQKRLARLEAKQASQLDKLMIACNKGKLHEVERLLQPEIGGMHEHAPTRCTRACHLLDATHEHAHAFQVMKACVTLQAEQCKEQGDSALVEMAGQKRPMTHAVSKRGRASSRP